MREIYEYNKQGASREETYIESESGREWLIELDRWTIKKLNKLGGLDLHTDKAYWINFRGYCSLYSEASATYFGYSLDKTMNNPAVNINIRTAKAIEVEMTAKRFGLTLRANRTDTIDRKLNKLGGLDPHTDKAYWINFRGYRSLYSEATATYFGYLLDKTMNNPAVNINIRTAKAIEVEMTAKRFGLTLRANRTDTIDRLIQGNRVITTDEIDKINMDAPADSKKYNKWTFQLQKAIRKIQAMAWQSTIGHDEMNVGRRITGAQEINHAELRGILRAITHTGAAHNLTIYSDSFNSVLFCTKAIERREAKGLTTKFLHNKQRFGKRHREIEKGNEEADRLASIAYIRENITSTPDYTLETGDPHSLPKKKEPYSNLITKIMTGTIWTNKRKKPHRG
ncbi:hypothetical protein PROFUN_08767 [Planoprotostelium fungivorum]|uniref:Uncharacterized protein n=1 Tax=Planoprotostelium fungivorum TaxID=1890364 RepID=A0A2P6MVQ7_9EUKA|nr:hypothetical protein PROFUN_08767 [Planoprotostelium fungivorum]